MLMVAEPEPRVFAAEVKPPPVIVTDPVGTGAPLPPLTATDTISACVVVMLEVDGVTVTVGVAFATVKVAEVPVALLYVGEEDVSGV